MMVDDASIRRCERKIMHGQSSFEYALVVALAAILSAGALVAASGAIRNVFSSVNGQLRADLDVAAVTAPSPSSTPLPTPTPPDGGPEAAFALPWPILFKTPTAFTSSSTGFITSYDWNWGDGTPDDTTATASHAYIQGHYHTVTLTVSGPGGSSSVSHDILVPTGETNPTQTATQAGYYIFPPGTSQFTAASGTWTQLSVVCDSSSEITMTFVGIDNNAGTLAQAGTVADCRSGKPVYWTFTELYPASTVQAPIGVAPGDTIGVSIAWANDTFTMTVRNLSRGTAYSTAYASTISRVRAEWIVERPSGNPANGGGPFDLAPFGSLTFSNASAQADTGITAPAYDPAWPSIDRAYMDVNGVIEAQPPVPTVQDQSLRIDCLIQ